MKLSIEIECNSAAFQTTADNLPTTATHDELARILAELAETIRECGIYHRDEITLNDANGNRAGIARLN